MTRQGRDVLRKWLPHFVASEHRYTAIIGDIKELVYVGYTYAIYCILNLSKFKQTFFKHT